MMEKEIVKDVLFLSLKSTSATIEDVAVIQDLKDTLLAHHDHCVGLAANMIGSAKTILAFSQQEKIRVLINPVVLKTSKETYLAQEGCLCHPGQKEVRRYQSVKLQYLDENFKTKIETFSGYTAEIIQHEMDHFAGILI